MNPDNFLLKKIKNEFQLELIPEEFFEKKTSICDYNDELHDHVEGRLWTDVTPGFWVDQGILRTGSRFSITPEASYYYVPSVIIDVLNQKIFYIEDFTSFLLPTKGKEYWWDEFFNNFNEKQKHLIIEIAYDFDSQASIKYKNWYSSTQEYHDLVRILEVWGGK